MILAEKTEVITSGRGDCEDPYIVRQYEMMYIQTGSETSIDIVPVGACCNLVSMVADWMVAVVSVWHEESVVWSSMQTIAGGLIMDIEMLDNKMVMGYNDMASTTMVG